MKLGTIVAAVFLLMFLGAITLGIVVYFSFGSGIRARETALQQPVNYHPAAMALAQMCQTCQAHPQWFTDRTLVPAWMPPEVLRLNPNYARIDGSYASVEFGGGFYHFGYSLTRAPTGDRPGFTAWAMALEREEKPGLILETVSIPNGDVLTEKVFVDRAFVHFELRTGDNGMQMSSDASDAAQRFQFALLHHELERFKQSVRKFAAQNAHNWRDVLLVHVMDSAKDQPGAAAKLNAWAASINDFSAWLLAAYAFDAAGDSNAAASTVMSACRFPADDPAWLFTNARFRGLAMCRKLYSAGKYDACTTLSRRVLDYSDSQSYLSLELSWFPDACSRAKRGSAPELLRANDGTLFDPFDGIDLKVL